MKTLLLLSILSAPTCFSQDTQGQQDKWIYFGEERPETSYPSASLATTDSREYKTGSDTSFYRNGAIHRIIYLQNGKPSGEYTIYHPNGQLKESGRFHKNQFSDSLKRFHENGKPEYEVWYNEMGKENGSVNYYFPNGQLEFTYTANNGTPHGTAYRYYENGDLSEITEYAADGSITKSELFESKNPLPEKPLFISDPPPAPFQDGTKVTCARSWNPNGYNKIYRENNQLWLDGVFKNGALWDGKAYIYGEDNTVVRIKLYHNGVYLKDGEL